MAARTHEGRRGIDHWFKDVAPSTELRRWYGHEPARWDAFRAKYRAELEARPDALTPLRALAARGSVTLVFAARDEARNGAVVLRELLEGGDVPRPEGAPPRRPGGGR